ncbi:MAG: hypothetical protein Q9162_003686 [Coniocarpon cinnabarinum]
MALPPSRTAGGVNALLIDFAESDLQQSIAKEQNELAHVLRVLFFWSVRIISLPPSQINQPEDFADEMIGVIQEHMQTNGHKPDLAFIHVPQLLMSESNAKIRSNTSASAYVHWDTIQEYVDDTFFLETILSLDCCYAGQALPSLRFNDNHNGMDGWNKQRELILACSSNQGAPCGSDSLTAGLARSFGRLACMRTTFSVFDLVSDRWTRHQRDEDDEIVNPIAYKLYVFTPTIELLPSFSRLSTYAIQDAALPKEKSVSRRTAIIVYSSCRNCLPRRRRVDAKDQISYLAIPQASVDAFRTPGHHMDRPIDQSEDITILVEPPPGLLVLHAIPLREKGSSAKTPDTSKVL